MRILALLVALQASAVDASTTTPLPANLKTQFGGWFSLGAASKIQKQEIERAGQITLADILNISELSINTTGKIYHSTTFTTSSSTTLTTTTSTNTTSTLQLITSTTNVSTVVTTTNASTSTSTNVSNSTSTTTATTTSSTSTTITFTTTNSTLTSAPPAPCIVPTINHLGFAGWMGSTCETGKIVVTGTSCHMIAARGYTCEGPGLCVVGGFVDSATCREAPNTTTTTNITTTTTTTTTNTTSTTSTSTTTTTSNTTTTANTTRKMSPVSVVTMNTTTTTNTTTMMMTTTTTTTTTTTNTTSTTSTTNVTNTTQVIAGMVQARRLERSQLSVIGTASAAPCKCSCPFTTVTTSSLTSTITVIGAELRQLVHMDSTTTGPWKITNEYTRYWNVSYAITIPVEQTDDVKGGLQDIAGDQTNFNESLWLNLVYTQNVDPALSAFYEYVGFAFTSETLVYPAAVPPPTQPSKPWPEISGIIAIAVCVVLLLLTSYYITFRTKVSHWKKVDSSKIHLDILFETRSFGMFCRGKGLEHQMNVIRTSPWEKATPRWWRRAMANYCKFLSNNIKVFLIAGWRYVIGIGLYSLAMSNCIRAARDLTYDDGERMVSDETIDANLAAAKKVFQVVLPLTGTMMLAYIITRMLWLNASIELCNKFARGLEEIASMCIFLLPPVDMGFESAPPPLVEVTKARYLLYCYFNTLHLFFFADSSEQLRYGVRELVFQEALSRSKLLLEREEEELYKSHEPSTHLFIWSSRLVIEIARSCESNSGRPCQQELMDKLLVLQKTLRRFHGKLKQRNPISFMQLMHLMVDGTVIVTPIAIAETCGADHHSYSFYFFPCICSLLLALFFQGGLRFAKVTEDPFGAGCGGESYTNECLLNTERSLFTILALRQRNMLDVDLPEQPEQLEQPEPVWKGDTSQDFLKGDFLNELYPHPDPPPAAPPPPPTEPKPKDRRVSGSSERHSSGGGDELKLGDISFEDAYDYSEGTDDPEELSRPPDAVVSSSSNDTSPQAKTMQERLEDAEKELAETEMERRVLRDLVKQREKQMIELQAESIPADDANELIKLMSEWVNPKRPVRVSDVTFFKLAELARKQTTRVKKILALPIAGRSDPYSETHRHITAASLIASESVNKHDSDGVKLMKLVRARLDEEEKATARLKYQLAETLARARGEALTEDGKKLVKATKANVQAVEKQTSELRSLTQGATGNQNENRARNADDDDFEMKLKAWESSNSMTMMGMNSSQRSWR